MEITRKRQLIKEMLRNKFSRNEITYNDYKTLTEYVDLMEGERIERILESRIGKVMKTLGKKMPGNSLVFPGQRLKLRKLSPGQKIKLLKKNRKDIVRDQNIRAQAIKRLGTKHPVSIVNMDDLGKDALKSYAKLSNDEIAARKRLNQVWKQRQDPNSIESQFGRIMSPHFKKAQNK